MELPVLKYVDVLIGLALVMLLAATVALSISQALLNLWAARSRHLAWGLERLIHQIHPQVLGPHARDMSRLVLMHPLVGLPRGPVARFVHWLLVKIRSRLPQALQAYLSAPRAAGRVILREEFAICLLEWASDDGPGSMSCEEDTSAARADARRAALVEALRERGIEDPSATLKAVKLQAMFNERDHPEQPAELWRSQALAQCAASEFLAGLFIAFDNTMQRSTTTYGMEAQMWVTVVALVLVFAMQLDAIQLVKRLAIDDAYRASLVSQADQLTTELDRVCPAAPLIPGEAAGPSRACTQADVAKVVARVRGERCDEASLSATDLEKCRVRASLAILQSPALDIWPASASIPALSPSQLKQAGSWSAMKASALSIAPKLPGILLSWILVSLGAPFWYDLLKNLFKLRSLVAQKDDADRAERNAGAKPPAATVTVNRPGGAGPASPPATTTTTIAAPPATSDDGMGDPPASGAQGEHVGR